MTTTVPARPGDLSARVAALVPGFRERAARAEAQRRIPLESITELVEAGVARMLVPREHGGDDLTLRTLVEVTATAARGCPSTGWCAGLLAHVPHQVALFPTEGREAVWAGGPDTRLAGSVMPAARAEVVPGGYRITGRHGFTSGVDHAEWVFVGGAVPAPVGPPDWRLFLVDAGRYTVQDTWHTTAMRGTGSNTVVVEDVFVPEGHTLRQVDAREGTGPSGAVLADPKFRLPWSAFSALGFSATVLGAAQGAYADFIGSKAQAKDPSGRRVAEARHVQVGVGEAGARLDAAQSLLLGLADRADSPQPWTPAARARASRDNRLVATLVVEAIDGLVELAGSGAFAESSPLQRAWRDIHFAVSHVSMNRVDVNGRAGRHELGVAETDPVGFF